MTSKSTFLEKAGLILVLLMILLQGFYGMFAYLEPLSFASLRGTELFSEMDTDWIKVYGSRTLFITAVLGYLLFFRHYVILMWCALFGCVMPITDAFLAYQAQAPVNVVAKHMVTILYLLVTFAVLKRLTSQTSK